MKKFIITLLAFVLAIAVVSAEARTGWGGRNPNSDWGKAACIERAPNVQRAIERYCNNKNGGFFIPSVASKKALRVGNELAKIDGGCNPGQWLPRDICFKQFYSMCVSGNGRGENNRQYGNNRCQKWRISNPK